MTFVLLGPSWDDAHLDTRYRKYSRGGVAAKVWALVDVEVFCKYAAPDIGRVAVTFVDINLTDLDRFLACDFNAL